MTTLFLDIETVPDLDAARYNELRAMVKAGTISPEVDRAAYWKFKNAALSPIDGRVMLITYKVDGAYTHHLKEWEDGEKKILTDMFRLVFDLQSGLGEGLRIVGHNIMKFDINFLYERMRHHEIADPGILYKKMIRQPLVADFLQMHLPLNDMNGKGLKHDVLAHAYGLPTKSTQGSDETAHYFDADYGRIMEYSEREFIYPDMYAKICSDGLVSREALQESIRWYDSLHENDSPRTSL